MYQHLPSPVKFREDINGLRAWAVIAVLLFHFSLIGLPGGFSGVDVFFVISGYLMTAIIVGGYEKGNFSIWNFYMARARRILPALLFVIAILLALGWFWLPTPGYQDLGTQSAYGISFLSNIYYSRSAGYFDSIAEEKWLLHTWSLAVEAQFYVLYPIFITVVWKFWKSLKAITILVLIMFIASIALNLFATGWKPTAAFYLLPTRGWELAAGGLVYLIAKQELASDSLKYNGYWLGWILIISSFFLISEHLAWPGYWAILPVLGTSLIILGQRESCKLTDNAIVQWLGDRSYSLYLWHWPLVVALHFTSLQNEWGWVIGTFALSILLAHLSFIFVETPTRQYLSQASLFREILVIATIGAFIGVSAISIRLNTFEDRFNEQSKVDLAAYESLNKDPRRASCEASYDGLTAPKCKYGNEKTHEISAIVMGDSHAMAVITSIGKAAENNEKAILSMVKNSCPTIFDRKYYGDDLAVIQRINSCNAFNQLAFDYIDKNIPNEVPIISVSRTSAIIKGPNDPGRERELQQAIISPYIEHNLEQITLSACEIQKSRQLYLMRPIPEIAIDIPKTLSRNILLGQGDDDIKITLEDYHERNKLVWRAQDKAAEQCGVKILNPLPYLCDDKYCYGSKNGRPLYYDDDHLSEYGNKFLISMFQEVFNSMPKD